VLHYDLPWNPNRLEQREGRVDRFGQTAPNRQGLPALWRRQPHRWHRPRRAAAQGARDQARHRHQRAVSGRFAKHHRHHHPGAAAQPEPPGTTKRPTSTRSNSISATSTKRPAPRPTSPAKWMKPPSARRLRAASSPNTPSRPTRSRPICARWTRPSAIPGPSRISSPRPQQPVWRAGRP
jgi:hypothetical protein